MTRMRSVLLALPLALVARSAVPEQPTPPRLTFEVASIRLSQPDGVPYFVIDHVERPSEN